MGLKKAILGNAKPGIFINKIPRTAIPLKLSKIIIRSLWLVGAADKIVDMLLVLVVLRQQKKYKVRNLNDISVSSYILLLNFTILFLEYFNS